MPEKERRDIIPSSGGVFQDLAMRIKLILRLIADPRVNLLLKVIPIGTVVYLIMPDLAPGPIDDAALMWAGLYLFVELCPSYVVAEHMADLTHQIEPGQQAGPDNESNDVVDAEYKEY